jgi:hypothetical protein
MVSERSGQIAEELLSRPAAAAKRGLEERQSYDAPAVSRANARSLAARSGKANRSAGRHNVSKKQSWHDLEAFTSNPQDEGTNYRHGACNSEKKLPVHKKLGAITRILLSELNLSLVQGRVANIASSVLLNWFETVCGAAELVTLSTAS